MLYCLVSFVYFSCVVQDYFCHYMSVGTMWHCAFASCTPSQSIGLFLGCALFWCPVSLCIPFTNSLIACYSIMMVAAIIGIFMPIAIHFGLHNQIFFGSATTHLPGCFCPWTFFFEYWNGHVTFVLLYVMFRFATKTFPSFATDCHCVVWRRWLTTFLLYVGPRFGNLVWNDTGFVS